MFPSCVVRWSMLGAITGFLVAEAQEGGSAILKSMTLSTGPWLELVSDPREPVGLMRSGDQRPDGCTLASWEQGKGLSWDATIHDTLAQSHLCDTSVVAGAAAERAAKMKHDKYQELTRSFEFCTVAIETLIPINEESASFLTNLGHHLSVVSGDRREIAFLFQRLFIILQRCNAVSFPRSFDNFWLVDNNLEVQKLHTFVYLISISPRERSTVGNLKK